MDLRPARSGLRVELGPAHDAPIAILDDARRGPVACAARDVAVRRAGRQPGELAVLAGRRDALDHDLAGGLVESVRDQIVAGERVGPLDAGRRAGPALQRLARRGAHDALLAGLA